MGSAISAEAQDILFRKARSFDRFLDEPVPEALLHQVWDLLKMGPTSANQLPARLVWCASAGSKALLAKSAFGDNQEKIRQAPLCAILGMDLDFHETLPELFPRVDAKPWFRDPDTRRVSAFRNSTLQGGYLILALRALGLDVGPMSAFDNDAVDADFFADTPSVKSNFICVVGYGDPVDLPPRDPRPAFGRFNRLL